MEVLERLPGTYAVDPYFVAGHRRYCCHIGCNQPAEWEIYGDHPYNGTDACTAHVGILLDDSVRFTVLPIGAAN